MRPLSQQSLGQRLTTTDALSYLRDVKQRFSDNKQVYDTFLEIMKEFKAQRVDTPGVIQRVRDLFKGHPELIYGFNTFLPKGYQIEYPEEEEEPVSQPEPARQPIEFDTAISYVNKIKARFANDEKVYKAFLEILNMYRKAQKTINDVYDEVSVLFRSHTDLLEEFAYFLPDNSQPGRMPGVPYHGPPAIAAPPKNKAVESLRIGVKRTTRDEDEDTASHKRLLSKEMKFFDVVKNRLRNTDMYQDFLKCLHMYAQEIISKRELQNLINDILGRFPDLLNGFDDFLETCEVMEIDVDARALKHELSGVAGHEGARTRFKNGAASKYFEQPISELDLSSCQRICKSYVHLPADYPALHCSGRDKLPPQLRGVFNDEWVNVTSGSEDYSFKHMRKNQYEENLFRCEDDHFDLDMDMGRNTSTIEAMQPIIQKLNAMSEAEMQGYCLEEGELNALHRRNIIRVYGDHGEQMFELLMKQPAAAAHIVMARLQQKDAEWRKVRDDMANVWKRIYEQNYQRSLDHRSFYFKQADKKQLGAKIMTTELKEACDKRKQQELNTRPFIRNLPFRQQLTPDLEFKYNDAAVHVDLRRVLNWAAKNQCPSNVAKQVMELMDTVVEPLFGVSTNLPPIFDNSTSTSPHSSQEKLDQKSGAAEGSHASFSREGSPDGNGSTADDNRSTKSSPNGSEDERAVRDGGSASSAEADTATNTKPSSPILSLSNGCSNGARPVCCALPLDDDVAMVEESKHAKRVLYANEQLYIFFRLHQHLFNRLQTAHACARQTNKPGFRATHLADLTEEQKNEAFKAKHSQFIELLYKLFHQKLDMTSFEDQIRIVLGTTAYTLCTLDKLIVRLLKHLQAMLQDEQTLTLLSLYKYESAREAVTLEETYYNNCQVLMQDEAFMRIEYRSEDETLTVQCMEPSCRRDDEKLCAPDSHWDAFYQRYSNTKSCSQRGGQYLVLRRNLIASPWWRDYGGDDSDDAMRHHCYMNNSLVIKIDDYFPRIASEGVCARKKQHMALEFVNDSEDVMWRIGTFTVPISAGTTAMDGTDNAAQLSKAAVERSRRQARYDAWLDSMFRVNGFDSSSGPIRDVHPEDGLVGSSHGFPTFH